MLTVGTAAPTALLDVIEAVQAIPTVEDTRPMIALTTFAGTVSSLVERQLK